MANTINVKLRLATNDFVKSLNKAEKNLRRSGQKMASIGDQMMMSLSAPLAAIGGAALKSFADMEKFTNGLASMMGGADAAAAEMEKLKEIAKDPGLDLSQAVKGSVRLQSVGIAADQARKVLAETGNAIALVGGSSDDLDGVTLALQQIGSKGKVFAEEINQINERLPQIRAAMKAAFGTANTEDIQEMGISAEQFIAGITTELGKLPRATGGMANAFNNARQAVTQALSDMGASLEENFNVSARIDNFSERVQNLATAFTNLPASVQKTIVVFSGLLVVMGPALKVGGAFRLAMAAMATQAVAVTRIFTVFMNVINAFTLANVKSTAVLIAQKVALLAQNVVMVAQNALLGAATVLVDGYILAETALIGVKKVLTGQVKLMTVAQTALNAVMAANPIALVVLALAALGTAFVAAYQNIEGFRRGVDVAVNFVRKQFGLMSKAVVTAFRNFPAVLKATFAALKAFVSNVALNFKKLTLSAKEFQLRFTRALTISKDKRAELTKSINAIGDQKENIAKQGKKIGQVFKETFLSEVDKIRLAKITGPSILSGGDAAAAGGDGGAPVSRVAGTKAQTEAVKEQVKAVQSLQRATTLQGVAMAQSLEPAQALGETMRTMEIPTAKFIRFGEQLTAFNEQLTEIVNDGLVNFVSAMGTMTGKLVAGKASFKDFAAGVLGTVVGVLEQLGQLAIKTGVGLIGIKLALKTLNPAVALAAGFALKAFAGFIGSKVSDLATPFAKGGIVMPRVGGTIAQIGEAGKAEAVIPLDRLDSMLSNSGGGGGGRLVAEVRGRDMLFMLEKEKQYQNRAFGG